MSSPVVTLLDRLQSRGPLNAVELRPPKSGLTASAGMDSWIDMHHSVRQLTRADTVLFLTDNAVGQAEEENLNHLAANLADAVPSSALVPFLTAKHSLDYCLMYAARASALGLEALTVLGGDRSIGPPRCVEHAYELRRRIRERQPDLVLGGWANPHRDPASQAEYVADESFSADFVLTQVVSHHNLPQVEEFLVELRRRDLSLPVVFGVFFYRSANPRTLERLGEFFPVPAAGITHDFESGMTPVEICAQTIVALRNIGVDKIYLSNLGFNRPHARYRQVLEAVGDAA